ncbi:GxxExxY protein [bacterium]|jgi:GxxExxY protein|nr:GxxExxY protein [Verrucomicrobiota bacterium]MDA7510411.1 GxxExxY protein [Verrucomicrobiota bacterium]MDA7633656.1 GxxExxY protein [bacterium]MDA7657542.1 GxxExxY protein [Verrucomicrobiota bacterium]
MKNAIVDDQHHLTRKIIGAAIEVHRDKGHGLLESIYEWCLSLELKRRGLRIQDQEYVEIEYKRHRRQDILKFDLLVEELVMVEIKAVEMTLPIHKAQLLSYMKLISTPVGLLINFNVPKLTEGISRLLIPNK